MTISKKPLEASGMTKDHVGHHEDANEGQTLNVIKAMIHTTIIPILLGLAGLQVAPLIYYMFVAIAYTTVFRRTNPVGAVFILLHAALILFWLILAVTPVG